MKILARSLHPRLHPVPATRCADVQLQCTITTQCRNNAMLHVLSRNAITQTCAGHWPLLHPSCSNKPEHIYCNRKSILEPEVGQLTKLVRGRRWGRTGQDRVVLSCNDPGIVTRTIQISTAYIVTIFGDLCSVLTLSALAAITADQPNIEYRLFLKIRI